MTSITGFRYDSFEHDLCQRSIREEKVGMSLSLMPNEEFRALAVVEVEVPLGRVNRAEPYNEVDGRATFWDTRMGCFQLGGFPPQTCRTCKYERGDERAKKGVPDRCNGHFGYISLPVPVYNPPLQSDLLRLLSAQCFFCHRFITDSCLIRKWEVILTLFDAGCVADARGLQDLDKKVFTDYAAAAQILRENLERSGIDPLPYIPFFEGECGSLHGRQLPPPRRDPGTLDVRTELLRHCFEQLKPSSRLCPYCHGSSPIIAKSSKRDTAGCFFYYFPKREILQNLENGIMTSEDVADMERDKTLFRRRRRFLHPSKAREHIKALCKNETMFLSLLYSHIGEPSVQTEFHPRLATEKLHHLFFLCGLLVPPLPLRLQSGALVKDGKLYPDEKTSTLNEALKLALELREFVATTGEDQPEANVIEEQEVRERKLQMRAIEIYASTVAALSKKEGLLRWNLMGKRVNQACRSVISPDFTVEPNEILLPRTFARRMTFPEEITFHCPARTKFLQQCVINGPNTYPGATHIEIHKDKCVKVTELRGLSRERRQKRAEELFIDDRVSLGTIYVYRHVVTGDRLIFNRQPTLHKPSMQGYRARVLSGLKTIRFHYVNAKAYNADFDGDEMNIHVPQSIEAAAEVDTLMDGNLMYIAPTSGTPLRGLIQDHISSGVLLTLRDRFFSPEDFMQLLYMSLQPYLTGLASTELSRLIPLPAVAARGARGRIIVKFTGKQLVSAILRFITGVHRGSGGINIPKTGAVRSLIQPKVYGFSKGQQALLESDPLGDHLLCVINSTLVSGVLCKLQLGPSSGSITHLVYEIYGAAAAGKLFGALGRVLTAALQRSGFSMGMNDMIISKEGLERRQELLDAIDISFDPRQTRENEIVAGINEQASGIQKEFFPARLKWHFPENQLVLMTQSEAKGKANNAVQMALMLGQQTFNNERGKPLSSGKSFPAFFVDDPRARSYGFVMGSFASGIRPGEYTFHAMAGRDGLIDTGTKTSDSGFLQRCLIKGLESQRAEWDHTVRDAEGSVIQFLYGGDGLDTSKVAVLSDFQTLLGNKREFGLKYLSESVLEDIADELEKVGNKDGKRHRLGVTNNGSVTPSPLTVQGKNPLVCAVTVESRRNPLPAAYANSIDCFIAETVGDEAARERTGAALREIVNNKRLRSSMEAGEPVGMLAAHAAGEPSTQMTLNTFHSAGSTDSHVNTGIPRLRELLQFAKVHMVEVKVPVCSNTSLSSLKDLASEGGHGPDNQERRLREVLAASVERERIWDILDAAQPQKLEDYLIPGSPRVRMVHTVQRTASNATLSVDLLFSWLAVRHLRGATPLPEHVTMIKTALRRFAVSVLRAITKGSRQGAEDGAAVGGDDADAGTGAAFTRDGEDGEDGDEYEVEKGDDDGESDVEEQTELDYDDEDENNDSDGPVGETEGEGGAGDEGDDEEEAGANSAGEDDEMVACAVQESETSSENENNYKGINMIFDRKGKGRMRIKYVPFSRAFPEESSHLSAAAVDRAMFVIHIIIDLPSNFVAVVPDVLTHCLAEARLSSVNLPQCEQAFWRYTDESNPLSNGELVFRGEGATINNVRTLVALVAPELVDPRSQKAVKLDRIRNSDFNDTAAALGIECAYKHLLAELVALFKSYSVNARHLSLIADTAMHRGFWEGYVIGIPKRNPSPLYQMSVSRVKEYLENAVTKGISDELQTVSSSIVVGSKPNVGTKQVVINTTPILGEVLERC